MNAAHASNTDRKNTGKKVSLLVIVAGLGLLFTSRFPTAYFIAFIVYILLLLVALGLLFKEATGIKSTSLSTSIIALVLGITLGLASFFLN
ncbi:MAG: hypothetical protein SPH31_04160 [Arcanobacterium sp.]|nr:hypothetical protein [Arcanobacterium sp.]